MIKTDTGNGSYGIYRVIDASRSLSPDPGRSPKQQTTFTTMEVFGMLGFSFGMMAFAITASLQSEVKKLRKEVDELKQKLPHS